MSDIIVENRLREVFNFINPVPVNGNNFDVHFDFGTLKDLNVFLTDRKRNQPFPLIWLQTPYESTEGVKDVTISDMKLVVAVPTTQALTPRERIDKTFESKILPVVKDVKRVIRLANTMHNDQNYKTSKYFNYGENNEVKAIDNWDAITLTFDLMVNDTFLRPIVNKST